MKKTVVILSLILFVNYSFSQKARLVLRPNPKFNNDTVLVYLYYWNKEMQRDTIFYSENVSKEYLQNNHIIVDFDIPTKKEVSFNVFVVNQDLKAEILFHKLKRNTSIGITIEDGVCFGKPCNNYIKFFLHTIKIYNKAFPYIKKQLKN